ncbi:hypothetical protein DXT88_05865 [Herbaspirillum lusitanum]|uniref:hypothetical protein n=1 Tax=Herbaspirillum lusitanum TaxID=213312 RepID=UPI002237870A|nr:hypothetical protein [Herbaspirillum lusitanum]MCW5297698.1 hypothetical protein [Herbaspirillum lusitanum]
MAVIYEGENGKRMTYPNPNKPIERAVGAKANMAPETQHAKASDEAHQGKGAIDTSKLPQVQNADLENTEQGSDTDPEQRIFDQLNDVSDQTALPLTSKICLPEKNSEINDIIAGLKLLQPNSRQVKVEKFRVLFPVIKEVLDDNVPQRAVIDYLASQGLKLSPNTFRAMFEAESQRMQNPGTLPAS